MKWDKVPRAYYSKDAPEVAHLVKVRLKSCDVMCKKGTRTVEDASKKMLSDFHAAFDRDFEDCRGYGIIVFTELTQTCKFGTEEDHSFVGCFAEFAIVSKEQFNRLLL